jgi:DNA-binding CsgD family transcriptional regulator
VTPTIDARRELYETLTEREKAVVRLLAIGRTCSEIATEFSISPKTIESHRGRALTKLQLRNTAELARDAIRVGFVPAPDEATP